MAGEITANTRTTISEAKSGISALKPKNTAYHSMDNASRRRLSHPATTLAKSGAPTNIMTAAAVISCPATATDTSKEVAMSLSVPGTIITPVPMTKLPNKSDHSTRGSGSWRTAGVFWGMDSQRMARCGAAKGPRIVVLPLGQACAVLDRPRS